MPDFRLRVSKYIPNKLYGFAGDDTGFEVFFHLGSFQPGPELVIQRCQTCTVEGCSLTSAPPPPILGEAVVATCDPEVRSGDSPPRASRVLRVTSPVLVHGVVDIYEPTRGYGFIRGTDSVSYHLHQSEVTDGRLPLKGSHVVFFAGTRNNRPRACHVRVCR